MKSFSEAMGQAPQPQADAPSTQTADGTPATPEQQAQYNRFVGMGMSLLWGDQMMPQVVQMLQKAPGKVDAMARVGSMLVGRLYSSAMEQGTDLDSAVLLYGGIELMGEVGELARHVLGEITEEQLEDAIYLGADMLGDVLQQQGITNPDAMAADLAEIEKMLDQEGTAAVIDRVSQTKQTELQALMGRKKEPMQ